MNTKNLPAKLLAAVAVLFACGAMATGVTLPLANVARDYSPGAIVAANATATAAPVALAPTQTYQERVQPIQQAVEAKEIVLTTEERYANERAADTAWLWMRIGVGIGVCVVVLCACIVYAARWSVMWIKQAREYEPVQVLPNRPLYFPRRAQLAHPGTMASISLLTEHAADIDHGTLLIEAGAGERIRITPGHGRRSVVPVVVDGVRVE